VALSLAEIQDTLLSGGAVPLNDTETAPRRRQMPLARDVLRFQ
jgi:hypothetical protein